MSDYRIIKTCWYHRLWDYFFKAGEPGFEIGTLACKLYLDGKTGPVQRVSSYKPVPEDGIQFIDVKISRAIEGPNEKKSKHDMRGSPSKQQTMPRSKTSIPTVVHQTLEHDSRGITGRGMGRLP